MLKVSVIVPVYNTAEYLDECLDSLERQTYGEVEVICVDDGSPDESGRMLDERARAMSNLVVVHQDNAGLSAARNAGMRRATGDILMFLDSDDWYADDACERVVGEFERTDADAVVFGAACVPEELAAPHTVELLSPRDAVYEGFEPDLLFRERTTPYAWRVALSRGFAQREHIEFDESLRYAEDQAFCFTVYPASSRTAIVSDKIYRSRIREQSMVRSHGAADTPKGRFDRLAVVVEAILRAWRDRGFLDDARGRSSAAGFVTWSLDLLLFDLKKMGAEEAADACARLSAALSDAFGDRFWRLPSTAAARIAARRVADGKGFSGAVGKVAAARFFLGERGLAQCVERVRRR